MRPVVFLIGPHGCGKTTIGRMLGAHDGWYHLSLGDMGRLARSMKRPAELSTRFMAAMAKQEPGQPLRDEVVQRLLDEIERLRTRWCLSVDGFPSEAAHVPLLPADSQLVLVEVDPRERERRLNHRTQTTARKWTPGMRSLRDEAIPHVLSAAGDRARHVKNEQDPEVAAQRILALFSAQSMV